MIFTFMFTFKPFSDRHFDYLQNGQSDSSSTNKDDEPKLRPFTTGKSKRFKPPKKDTFELDPERKKKNLQVTIITIIFTGLLILLSWGFIIAMSIKYSGDATSLWAITFALVLLIDFLVVEVLVLYVSSKWVYKTDPSLYDS